jgi:hypothetical protein
VCHHLLLKILAQLFLFLSVSFLIT